VAFGFEHAADDRRAWSAPPAAGAQVAAALRVRESSTLSH
jgi:hypothetical protein